MKESKKIGLGGGCHWCTEAVFQALKGVQKVEQGYISHNADAAPFSEAVIVHYDTHIIPLETLIEIHLHTHNATSNHSFRDRYRSAVYYFSEEDARLAEKYLQELQQDFDKPLVTNVLSFGEFRPSREPIQEYFRKNPEAPFCKRYIYPKLELLKKQFAKNLEI